jgi:hypothetical protein
MELCLCVNVAHPSCAPMLCLRCAQDATPLPIIHLKLTNSLYTYVSYRSISLEGYVAEAAPNNGHFAYNCT